MDNSRLLLCILAVFLPPVAVLLCGRLRPFHLILNLLLCLCFWIPGVLHACYVVCTTETE